MKEKLYIIGAGSVGGHLAVNIDQYNPNYELCGFFDDNPDKRDSDFCGYPVLGPVSDVMDIGGASLFLGIAFPKIKSTIFEEHSGKTMFHWPNFIHRRAWVSEDATIGEGSIVYPGTTINYGSGIGKFVVINMNCALGHNTSIGNFSSLAPGVNTGGHTSIGYTVEMGIGVSTKQNVRIGDGSIIGAMSFVNVDIPDNSVAFGVPAKVVKKQS